MRWRDLSDIDKDQLRADGVINGCGPEGMKKVGFFLKRVLPTEYQQWCDQHDFNYYLGHTEADRIKADWQFYERLREVAKQQSWWCRPYYLMLAWLAYTTVRKNGREFFYYGPEEQEWPLQH